LHKEPVSSGKLAENILYFSRTLRAAGMKLGPSSVVDCVRAVEAGGISDRDDFYWTLHSVLVTRKEDMIVFEQAFNLFWRSRELVEKMIQMFSPQMREDDNREKPKAGESRVSEAMFAGQEQQKEFERPEIEIDRYQPINRIAKSDPRRMLSKAMRTGGNLVLPQFREPKMIEPPVVILADISGSMSQYSR